MTARFYDGDKSNNIHCDHDQEVGNGDSDPAWRGDFKGLIEKLDYIKALGFSAIWITPAEVDEQEPVLLVDLGIVEVVRPLFLRRIRRQRRVVILKDDVRLDAGLVVEVFQPLLDRPCIVEHADLVCHASAVVRRHAGELFTHDRAAALVGEHADEHEDEQDDQSDQDRRPATIALSCGLYRLSVLLLHPLLFPSLLFALLLFTLHLRTPHLLALLLFVLLLCVAAIAGIAIAAVVPTAFHFAVGGLASEHIHAGAPETTVKSAAGLPPVGVAAVAARTAASAVGRTARTAVRRAAAAAERTAADPVPAAGMTDRMATA